VAAGGTGEPGLSEKQALTPAQRRLGVGLVLGVTLVAFETTAVITALPTITDELGGDALYGVTLAAYTLAQLVSLVAMGPFADRRGARLPFIAAVSTFTIGLVVAAIAPTMAVVAVGRTLQGMGAGGFSTLAYALVRRAFPEGRQPTMYAILSAGWVVPSLIGPAFGGLITEHVGWRWVFAGIIPLAALVALISTGPMRAFGPAPDATADPTGRRDDLIRIRVAAIAAAGIGVTAIGLQAEQLPLAIGSVVIGLGVAIPMLRTLMPDGILRARSGFPAIIACRCLATATFLGVDSFVPLAADRIHGAKPLQQGFVIIGASLTWTLGQVVMARRPDARPDRAVRLGFLVMAVGVVLVAPVLDAGWPLWATFLAWTVGGFGMGLLFNPTTVVAMGYADEGSEARISSQVQLADSLGFSVMGALGGAVVAVADRTEVSLRGAIGTNFAIALVLALLGAVAARNIRRSSTTRSTAPLPVH